MRGTRHLALAGIDFGGVSSDDVGRDESQIKVVSPCFYRPALHGGDVVYFCRLAEILAGLGLPGPDAHARCGFWNLRLET